MVKAVKESVIFSTSVGLSNTGVAVLCKIGFYKESKIFLKKGYVINESLRTSLIFLKIRRRNRFGKIASKHTCI